jgi:hypothetical protein
LPLATRHWFPAVELSTMSESNLEAKKSNLSAEGPVKFDPYTTVPDDGKPTLFDDPTLGQ